MEAAAVNSVPLPDGPITHVNARPGDVLTLDVFLRDWSPGGDHLNAYQMQLEPMDFRSGSAGSIKPVDYDAKRERGEMNLDNCLVNQNDPRWLFAGKQTITIIDTRSAGYRWMSVLVDTSDARACEQDGVKHYAGTVHMAVSDDALGTFTIGFMEDPSASLLLDERGVGITPLAFETLTVEILPDVLSVIDALNGAEEAPVVRGDVDGDGKLAHEDARKAIDMLNGKGGEPAP